MTEFKYCVHCENEPAVCFDTEVDAMKFARECSDTCSCIKVEKSEIGEDGEILNNEVIWAADCDGNIEKETVSDNEFDTEFPASDIEDIDISDDIDYDEIAKQYKEYPADWIDDSKLIKEAVDALEENESEVECKCCFDIFPKESCVKTEKGYICKKCNQELHSHQGANLDLIDSDPFSLDYEDPRDFDEPEEVEVEDKPVDANEVRKHEKAINEELKVIIDFSDYKPWSGAVDTYELIKDADKLDELEAYFEELYPDGITATQINDILWFNGKEVLRYLGLGDEEDEEIDESIKEHINDRHADIESDQEYQGVDNAVVGCKKYTVVAHSEDEKPVDCKGEKPALEEPLAGKKVDAKLNEAKKDDELPVDPEAAKLEVHTMLNDLVADEIEAINGYDDAKAQIMDTPIEHKDNILDTIDHIKGEEQEHIDELIGATTEIPFEKEESHEEEYAVKSLAEALNEDKLQAIEQYLKSNKVAYLTAEWLDEGEHYTDEVSAYLNYKNNKFSLAISRYHASEDNNAENQEINTDEEEFSFESLAEMYEDKECKEILDRLYENNLDELAKSLSEETHAKYAKPEGDRIAAYNNALKYAKKENKPFIYGYTNRAGKFFAAETPMKVTGSPADAEKEFRSRYKNCDTVYVAYPEKGFVDENLEEDKKADESPVDPEAAKLEVHTMLNDLVADEIEAINGYDDAKAEIMDTPIEHKDNILDTIDHIKGEEQEHIDELIDATTEIPFDKEEETPAPEVEDPLNQDFPEVDEESEEKSLTETKAKPEGDKVKSYNDGLKLAKLHSKPVIYGYTNSSYGDKFFALDDPIVCDNVSDETKKFRRQYKSCNVVYVAYPNGQPIEHLLKEDIKFDVDGNEIFTKDEQEEYDCDEYGNSNTSYDQFHHCGWCEEVYPESDMRHEVDFGWICSRCEDELKSHGGPLTFIED